MYKIKRFSNSSLGRRIKESYKGAKSALSDKRNPDEYIKEKDQLIRQEISAGEYASKNPEFLKANGHEGVRGVIKDVDKNIKELNKDIEFAKKHKGLFKAREAIKSIKYNMNKDNYA